MLPSRVMAWTASDAREAAAAAHRAVDHWRTEVERLEGEREGTSEEVRPLVQVNIDHAKAMVQSSEQWASDMDREVERLSDTGESGGSGEGGGAETPASSDGDSPPTNPADQIGDAVEEVEAATAEVAETTAEAGAPEVAEMLEESVAQHLDNATEEVAQAAEEVETVAEAVQEETPPDTPEGAAADQAVEAAGEAQDAVGEAEGAVAEVQRVPEVRPDQEHWYYRPRFRRRKREGANA